MDIDEYLKGILEQILNSYKILHELDDNPNDLEIIKKETAKINGLLQVIHNKLNEKKYQSDHLVTLRKLSKYYITTYDYSREIEYVLEIYDEDPNRIKNLRMLIINSLNDKRTPCRRSSWLSCYCRPDGCAHHPTQLPSCLPSLGRPSSKRLVLT